MFCFYKTKKITFIQLGIPTKLKRETFNKEIDTQIPKQEIKHTFRTALPSEQATRNNCQAEGLLYPL